MERQKATAGQGHKGYTLPTPQPSRDMYRPNCFQGVQPRVRAGAAGGGPGHQARARPQGSHFLLLARPPPPPRTAAEWPRLTRPHSCSGTEAGLGRADYKQGASPGTTSPRTSYLPSRIPAPKAKVSPAHKLDSGNDVRGPGVDSSQYRRSGRRHRPIGTARGRDFPRPSLIEMGGGAG